MGRAVGRDGDHIQIGRPERLQVVRRNGLVLRVPVAVSLLHHVENADNLVTELAGRNRDALPHAAHSHDSNAAQNSTPLHASRRRPIEPRDGPYAGEADASIAVGSSASIGAWVRCSG